MAITQLWVEKHRPKTVDDYVFTDPDTQYQVTQWIKENSIPHLLFYGPAGTGKTTLAKVLINQLGIEDTDIMFANGSKEGRRIEWVDKLINFCQTMPFGPFKVVLIDEADYLNKESVQPAMRNLMEEYAGNVRFILTCNYPNRIISPLKSRCHEVHIEKTDQTEFTARAATVLVNENVDFDLDILDLYVKSTYPDLRKCLNLLQMNSMTGTLTKPRELGTAAGDFKLSAVNLFKDGKFRQARELICSQTRPEEMEDVFRWAYDNLDLWSANEEGQDEAILIIRRGLVNHASCADPEINLSATITELISLSR
jgi:DNA polymerase III delta prime subunit